MKYRVKRAQIGDKVIIRNLLQLYLYDMTEFEFKANALNKSGEYDYQYLDHYWTEKGRYPYLFFSGKEIAGFALVRRIEKQYSMGEFFILRKFRRRGLGLRSATEILKKHGGDWITHFLKTNEIAERFWEKVALNLSSGSIERGELSNIGNYLRFSVTRS